MSEKKDLLAILRKNSGCRIILDNDEWWICKPYPEGFDSWEDGEQDDWEEDCVLIQSSDDREPLPNDCDYLPNAGIDLLKAFVVLNDCTIEPA